MWLPTYACDRAIVPPAAVELIYVFTSLPKSSDAASSFFSFSSSSHHGIGILHESIRQLFNPFNQQAYCLFRRLSEGVSRALAEFLFAGIVSLRMRPGVGGGPDGHRGAQGGRDSTKNGDEDQESV